ncbi:hypothetical protein [Thalassotalea profundi]|uniref:Uncharacterized protein n=1 Tax=Thalassotalea profundi TaxID=2036687 RepID=A0ABQ3IPK2_9GAMM|nr:hypothetical protein [Thalassotalea profundi]GHE87313.1 hypothetical protein GCM10011501_15930 [Thalassotalea profundi]
MTEQVSFWQEQEQLPELAELCCALYERELKLLTSLDINTVSVIQLQERIKSLPYYVKRTAFLMTQASSPLELDVQNATWSAKQASNFPVSGQDIHEVNEWYLSLTLLPGLVVPVATSTHIVLDSIDRIDNEKQRFRTNLHGWFDLTSSHYESDEVRLLKPNKRVMTAACAGHAWLNSHKINPVIPTLREMLLSCAINWRNFKQPIAFKKFN